MTLDTFMQFVVTGLVNGSIYALIGLGFVVVYKVTGIINFAQGEYAMLGALLAVSFVQAGWPLALAVVGAVAGTALVGLLLYQATIRPAHGAPIPTLIVITVGVSILLKGLAQLRWGVDPLPLPPFSGGQPLQLLGASILPQHLWVIGGTAALVVALYLFFQRTVLGLALRANAANRFAADLVGISGTRMGLVAFGLAATIGAVGGVLVAPISYASYEMGALLGLKGFTAAVIGGIGAPYGAVAGGLLLGVLESLVVGTISSGYKDAVAFVLLIGVLLLRPGGLFGAAPAAAAEDVQSASAELTGRRAGRGAALRRALPLLLTAALVLALPLVVPATRLNLFVFIGINTILALGLVLLAGYAGQISLGHTAFYACGAYASAILTLKQGWPPLAAMLAGAVVAAAIAFALGRPIFRLRGYYLAMATLGLLIIMAVILRQWRDVTGGPSGLPSVPAFAIGGWQVKGDLGYHYLVWGLALALLAFALNLVHSRPGRALRALHASESAAAASGIDVHRAKSLVLVLSAVFASLAGSLYAHYVTVVNPRPFGFETMVALLTMLVIGGMGSIWGAPLGALLVGLLPELLRALAPGATSGETATYEQIAFGALLIGGAIGLREGLAPVLARGLGTLGRRLKRRRPLPEGASEPPAPPGAGAAVSSLPRAEAGGEATAMQAGLAPLLEVCDLAVAFGGLTAVNGVSFAIPRRAIVALIGPNGAGKTTTFNLIAGVLRPQRGQVRFADRPITGWPAQRVAAQGIARTFQNVRLFGHLTVLENVLVGRYRHGHAGVLSGGLRLPRYWQEERADEAAARHWLGFVGLGAYADRPARSLPLGQQRLVELARALALAPRLLLLDEPAAGLNPDERRALVALLRRLRAADLTILLIEHDMGLVMGLADRVVVLDCGRVLAAGVPAAVRREPAVVAAYLGDPV